MKWILDTDIGDDIDDLYALGYAIAKNLDILGVTTVFRSCELRAKLAKYSARAYGKDIPVYAGEEQPINTTVDAYCKPQRWLCDELYQKYIETGEKWLPQMLPEAYNMQVEELSAVDFMAECARKYGKDLGIIAIGPLTNLARALEKYPEEMNGIGAFYIMGGNPSESKPEWNTKLDVDAAKIVYQSKVDKYIVGADKTWANAGFVYEDLLKGSASLPSAKKVERDSLVKWKQQPLYVSKNPCLHDVIVIDAIANPNEYLFEGRYMTVITEGDLKGATISEKSDKTEGYVNVLVKMSEEKFKNNFIKGMKVL